MSENQNDSQSQNDDQQNQIDEEFQRKVKLNDDTEEYIFARGPKYDESLWPVQCFLCRWTFIPNQNKLLNHVRGERHIKNLKQAETEPPNAEEFRKPLEQVYSDRNNIKNPIKIYPGEDIADITPDFADRLLPIKTYKWDNPPSEKVAEVLAKDIIQEYNKECPILGLCYAFKMAKDEKVRYHCVLCEKDLTEMDAYQHFISLEHAQKYAETHYPETFKSLPDNLSIEQKLDVIRFYYHKIEEWKGLRPFYLVNANYFDSAKDRFIPRVGKIYHYNENTVKFTPAEIKKTANMIKMGRIKVPKYVESLPNQPQSEEECTKIDTSSEQVPSNKYDRSRKRNRNRSLDEDDKEKIARLGLDVSTANWQKYRILCDKAIRGLEQEYTAFYNISERHPKYQDEWRRFYRMRCDQLRRDRINPNNYNFMPDWNRYWLRYLEDCYNEDAEKCRFEIRKTLKLPFRCRTPSPVDNIIGRNSSVPEESSNNKGPVPLMELAISNPNRIPYGNAGYDNYGPVSGSRGEDDLVAKSGNNVIDKPQPLINDDQRQNVNQAKTENSGPISVLSVLRLLAALEIELGSLGPIANKLLGRAVLYEKESKLSANELLHENEYFTLFVTSMEKLKGVVQAGIISQPKINAATTCISDLETILNLFDEYLRRNPASAQKHIPSSEVLKEKCEMSEPRINSGGFGGNDNFENGNSGPMNNNKEIGGGIPSLMGNNFRQNNPFANDSW